MAVAPALALSDWHSICESSTHELMHAANDQKNWAIVCTTEDVQISRMVSTSGKMPIFMGSTTVRAPVMAVADLLSVSERKCEYDEIFVTSANVEHLDDSTRVERHIYKSPCPALISCRDLCLLVHGGVCGDGSIVMLGKSVSHASCPPVKGYVRAEVSIGGFILQPLTEDLKITQDALTAPFCRIIYIAQTDIRGRIPMAFTAQMFIKQPLIVARIREIVEKEMQQMDEAQRNMKMAEHKDLFNMLPAYPDVKYSASTEIKITNNEDVTLLN